MEPQIADGPGTRLETGFASYTYAPWAKVTVGQMRHQYSLEEGMATQDLDFAAQRSFVIRALAPDLQVGLLLSGQLNLANVLPFYYGVGIFNGCGRLDQCPSSIDNDGDKEFTGRLAFSPWTPFGNLTIGLNADHRTFRMVRDKGATDNAKVVTPVASTKFHRFNPRSVTGVKLAGNGVGGTQDGFLINGNRVTGGGDIFFDLYPFYIRGEYHYASQQRDGLGGGGKDLDNLIMQGGYGTLGFWVYGNKLNGLLVNGRYEQLRIDESKGEFNPADPAFAPGGEQATDIRAVTTGLTWHINPNIFLRGNYIFTNVSPHGNLVGMSSTKGNGEAHQGIAEFMLRF